MRTAEYFDGVTVKGEYKWHENGGAITHDLTENGVTIAGTETKGGVRVDEENKNQLIYTQSQENVSDLTLEGISFADGTTARTFDKTYDLTKAAIHAGSADTLFTEASRKTMEAGNAMTLVDAETPLRQKAPPERCQRLRTRPMTWRLRMM